MSVEQRRRQNLNLVTGVRGTYTSSKHGQQLDFLPDRWARINKKAKDKTFVFNNLHMHLHVDSFKEAFKALDGSKALGVDKVSKKEYGKNLKENLEDLTKRIRNGSYKPQPKREVLIPKANSQRTRPIAIACFEDKLVDWVIGRILQEVYEPLFIRNSFGYRPKKSADQAITACYNSLEKNKRQHVLEIDFSNFFNTIPHKKLMRVISKRITDRRFKGIIGRFLKGGLIQANGETLPSRLGTPQGSIMSPILANIYLHEVVDQWFVENYASYDNVIVRYADDAVLFFKDKEKAIKFKNELDHRCQRYGLSLNKDKTHILHLCKSNHEQFNFLGLTFYWGKQGSRKLLKVKTQKEKLHKAMREFEQWIKRNRNSMKLSKLWEIAKAKIRGHINYYGYWMNGHKITHFHKVVCKMLFKWLNRRSQKRSYNWDGFHERTRNFPLMRPLGTYKMKKLGRSPYVHC